MARQEEREDQREAEGIAGKEMEEGGMTGLLSGQTAHIIRRDAAGATAMAIMADTAPGIAMMMADTVLKAMGRRYDTAAFSRKISHIRERMEKDGKRRVFFGIDVIAGFPGETEELFRETYGFLEHEIRPAFIHIFPYSRRPGTPAAAMKGQVQDRVKTERVARLEDLCRRLHAEFIASNRGTAGKVLFESSDKNGMMYGYTENYIRIERPYDPDMVGRIIDITI